MKVLSIVPIAGMVLGIIAFLLFVLFIKRIKRRKKRILVCIIHFLIVIIFALLSYIFMLFYVGLKGYENFTYNKPVFFIECPIKSEEYFELKFVPLEDKDGAVKYYRIKGQQFVIEGHIIKWENFFVVLGMKPLYRVTRLTGRYISVDDEKQKERSVYEIAEETMAWRWLMRYGEKIPGIDAVYGSSSFKDAVEYEKYIVSITHNAFVIKEK